MSSLRFSFLKFILTFAFMNGIPWCMEAYAANLGLKWTDASNNETGFKIERMTSTGSYAQIATVAANVQTYTDMGLTSGTSYCYRVRAFNSAGTSAPSNASCATVSTTTTSTPPSSTGSTTGSPSTSTTSPSGTITRLSSKWSDYRVSVKMRSSDDDGIGLMFRYQDSENYSLFSWNSQHKYRRLEKRVGGVFKTLAQDAVPYTVGQTYVLQIVAQGSSIKVLIDGKTIFSVTDTSFMEGTIALYSRYNTGSSFDDVLVEDSYGEVLLSENFNDHDHVGWTIVDDGNQEGPSKWSATTGAMVQSSNIGSDEAGTYALFTQGSWQIKVSRSAPLLSIHPTIREASSMN